jgi:hypothetical protein
MLTITVTEISGPNLTLSAGSPRPIAMGSSRLKIGITMKNDENRVRLCKIMMKIKNWGNEKTC